MSVSLESLCTLLTDGTHYTPPNVGEGMPFLTVADMQPSGLNFETCSRISDAEFQAADRQNSAPKAGDVLFSKDGTVGKVHVVNGEGPFAVLSSIAIIRPDPNKLDPGYLAHFLRTPEAISAADRSKTGSALRRIILRDIKRLSLNPPPLPEQRRIAGILDQADALRRLRRRSLSRLSDLPPAVLNFAQSELPAAPLVNARSKLPEAPSGARWALLTDVARLATGHTPDRKKDEYWNGDIPWISLTDIRAIDGLESSTTLQNVTADGIKNSSAVVLPKGTVCLARTASVGFVTMMGREMATSQDFVNWVCGPDLDPIYLLYALIASRAELRSLAPGSTHKTIYFPTVESFRILLPNIDVQRQCATVIRQYWAERKRMEVDLAKLDSLFASLQHRAFRGKL